MSSTYRNVKNFHLEKAPWFFLTDINKQHTRIERWLLCFVCEMAIYFVALIWLLSQCCGTEEIMFHCELLGQHGPSPLKEARFRESSLLFSFRHECKTNSELLHLLQICHFFGLRQALFIKVLGSVINYSTSNNQRMLGDCLVLILKGE